MTMASSGHCSQSNNNQKFFCNRLHGSILTYYYRFFTGFLIEQKIISKIVDNTASFKLAIKLQKIDEKDKMIIKLKKEKFL